MRDKCKAEPTCRLSSTEGAHRPANVPPLFTTRQTKITLRPHRIDTPILPLPYIAAMEDAQVTYEDLNEIEAQFEDVETEIIRRQVELSRPIFEKRQRMVSSIPNFWPLVIEQAPPDIDEYIQPSDSALLLSSLTSLSVSHFEIEDAYDAPSTANNKPGGGGGGGEEQKDQEIGDPRSVAIRLEFAPNDFFEDRVLEKRFWHRRSPRENWSGLVSEPVNIRWKKGKDLTGGLLGMVCKVWEEEQKAAAADGKAPARTEGGPKTLTPDEKALKKRIESTGLGGLSFFAWFGFRGKRVTAEESRLAQAREREKRRLRAEGKTPPAEAGKDPSGEDWDDDEEDDDDDLELEIFADGDTLAVTISEDLWPGAVKYFSKYPWESLCWPCLEANIISTVQAQEQDAVSDDDFESDEDVMQDQPSPTPEKPRKGKT